MKRSVDSKQTLDRRRVRGVTRRLAVLVMVLVGSLAFSQGEDFVRALSNDVPESVARAALEGFAGPDLIGKDGPLAPIGLDLALLYEADARGAVIPEGSPFAYGTMVRGGYVVIDAIARDDAGSLLADLERLGLRDGSRFGAVVSGLLPVAALAETAALPTLRGARPARAARSVGAVTSQAFEAMAVDAAGTLFGLDGSDVAVGTLSDSYDCLTEPPTAADDVASGDLPTGVVVLADLSGCAGAIDEGRAMMQLIHDLAPGSSQLFHSAFNGYADFAQGILDLADAGADVIVDDIIYFAEPMFQDGIIAQAADQVVAAGVPYFSSAGNSADASYESPARWVSGATLGNLGVTVVAHDFDPGPDEDFLQQVTVPSGGRLLSILQWDDPSTETGVGALGPGGDIDFLLFDGVGNLLFSSVADNPADGFPLEGFQVTTPGTYNLAIVLFGVEPDRDTPSLLKYVDFGNATVDEYATNSPTSYGHANAAGASGVAAARYDATPAFGQTPPLPESFTSLGGVPILFDELGDRLSTPELRPKPDLTGVDGTDTTFFGSDYEPNGFPNFFGTSAAAPHVAAVAALLLDLEPSLTPDEIYAALADGAIDMETAGHDALTGEGLVQADASVASLLTTLPGLSLQEGAASPVGTIEAEPGDAVVILQVEASVRDGYPDLNLDDLELAMASVGASGSVADIAAVRLYQDADGDGTIDAGASPLASAVPDASGNATLAPTSGLALTDLEDMTLLVVLEFDDALATLPGNGWAWAFALPLLAGVAGLRRRRWSLLAIPLLALLLTACPATPAPPQEGTFTTQVTSATATYDASTLGVEITGLPIDGRPVDVTD